MKLEHFVFTNTIIPNAKPIHYLYNPEKNWAISYDNEQAVLVKEEADIIARIAITLGFRGSTENLKKVGEGDIKDVEVKAVLYLLDQKEKWVRDLEASKRRYSQPAEWMAYEKIANKKISEANNLLVKKINSLGI